MKKRLEEKLAMLAFGDLSPEETTRLEQEVAGDREAGRVLAEYRDMRSGLRAMSNIPEHQLSTERLRHAILTQGLKPKTRPKLGWLWMPGMAAALAFGVVMVRYSQNSNLAGLRPLAEVTNLSSGGPVALNSTPEDPFRFATASGEILSVAQPAPKPAVTASYTTSRANRRSRYDRDRIEALKEAVMWEFDNQLSSNMSPSNPAGAGSSRDMASTPASTSIPIVLIDSSKDTSTGAQKATEVDSASNVIVGG